MEKTKLYWLSSEFLFFLHVFSLFFASLLSLVIHLLTLVFFNLSITLSLVSLVSLGHLVFTTLENKN